MQRPRLQHISIPRPPGSHAEARAFYGGLLGLSECPVPEALSQLDLVWFQLDDSELHLYAQEGVSPHAGRHMCIDVDDLAGLRKRLVAAGYAPQETIPIPGRPRFFCEDPFGNLIEFTSIEEIRK